MEDQNAKTETSIVKVISLAFGLPWFEIIAELWKIGRKLMRGLANEGVYEVLDYQCNLELVDKEGKEAMIQKQEKVRYLQDNIIAYQDQAWGDGKILLDYRCSPGVPSDQYRLGHKTFVLISLREVRNKGDVDNFNIEWKMQNGFLKNTGFWGTSINHRIRKVSIQVVFPKSRPPLTASILESNLQRTQALSKDSFQKLPDGRWTIIWQNTNPRLYENYVLSWEW